MAKPIKPRALTGHEIEFIRLVAQGLSNMEIAEQFDIRPETVRSRLHAVYQLTGVTRGETDPLVRVRLAIWAFDNGIVHPAGVKAPPPPKATLPQERIPAELAAPMIRLSLDLLADQPRGDCKRWARRVVDAAGLALPAEVRRERASVGSVAADEAKAA